MTKILKATKQEIPTSVSFLYYLTSVTAVVFLAATMFLNMKLPGQSHNFTYADKFYAKHLSADSASNANSHNAANSGSNVAKKHHSNSESSASSSDSSSSQQSDSSSSASDSSSSSSSLQPLDEGDAIDAIMQAYPHVSDDFDISSDDFEVASTDGNTIKFSTKLSQNHTVLNFYVTNYGKYAIVEPELIFSDENQGVWSSSEATTKEYQENDLYPKQVRVDFVN